MKRAARRLQRFIRWFYRTRKRGTTTSVTLFILLLVVVTVHYLNAPAQGHSVAATDLPKTVKTTSPPITPAQTMLNDFFRLNLPPGYHVQDHQQTPANLLFDQTITKPGDLGTVIIAVAVENLPSGDLENDTSYTFRAQQPSVYQISTKVFSGDTVRIASDNQTSSVVAFWPHGAYLATVSLSSGTDAPSGDNNADELNSLQPILAAWQWK